MGALKESLRPAPCKLLVPLVVALIIASFTLSYLQDIPRFFRDYSAEVDKHQEYSDNILLYEKGKQSLSTGTDPGKIIAELEAEELMRMEETKSFYKIAIYPVKFSAEHLFFADTFAYMLDPYFPVPCERYLFINSIEKTPVEPIQHCRYYMDRGSYDRIVAPSPIKYPEYRQISLFELMLHTGIILVIIYLVVCLFFYLPKRINALPDALPYILVALMLLILVGSIGNAAFSYLGYKGNVEAPYLKILGEEPAVRYYDVVYCNETQIYNNPSHKLNQTYVKCKQPADNKADLVYYNIRPESEKEGLFIIYGYKKG